MGLGSILELKEFMEKYGVESLAELSYARGYLLDYQRRKQQGVHQVG